MRDLLLAIWFVWQAATSPFYPDAALKVEEARHWLDSNVRIGDRLTPDSVRAMESAEFKVRRVPADTRRDILREHPWSELPVAHIYVCEKAISSRPAVSVTDVRAWFAVNADNIIIHRHIVALKTKL
jgi:hypothetical protein